MISRRHFNLLLGGLISSTSCKSQETQKSKSIANGNLVVSTWNNRNANQIAFDKLQKSSSDLLSAIEKGINYVEADPNDRSVGYGGRPDREGDVTLDACIMDKNGNAGSVTYVKDYQYVISLARKVMEETPHVILSGSGAELFAEQLGYEKKNLLTAESKKEYEKWLEKSIYKPEVNIERHDTIGMIAKNENGNLSGGCSTSGMSYKMKGRVGDSPIIGAGLYVDNEVGASTATGLGELVLKECSTFLVVELMRQGKSPQNACKEAIERIIHKNEASDAQVGLIAINTAGEVGGYGIQKGFNYVVTRDSGTELVEAQSYYK